MELTPGRAPRSVSGCIRVRFVPRLIIETGKGCAGADNIIPYISYATPVSTYEHAPETLLLPKKELRVQNFQRYPKSSQRPLSLSQLCSSQFSYYFGICTPSPGKMGPTVINKDQPIELIGSRLRDHTRTFDCGARARSNSRKTLPGEGKLFSASKRERLAVLRC